ncbi:ROK family protein [Lacticaseibacillus jixiensis]|uniref:ROK family protein n=1 Tax=Lacticaseibacillus jixiensis TaxID=3231926 RepID=UPI0036F2E22D
MTYLAIDVGGTAVKYALITATGQVVVKGDQLTHNQDAAQFIASLEALITRHAADIEGVGLALPGVVDSRQGLVLASSSLPFLEGVPLFERLSHALGKLPISIENDGNAAAYAEKWQGHLAGVSNGAMVVLGTGIGAAVFLNDQLYRGAHYVGGEPSFMVIDATNPDRVGQTAAGLSAVGMINSVAEKLDLHEPAIGNQVFSAIATGQKAAVTAFRAFSRGVAILLYNMQAVLDLQRIVIGGGISAQPLVATQLSDDFRQLQQVTPLAARTIHAPQIVSARFYNDANLIGAVYPLLRH